MYTELLDLATCLVVLICLWIRRATWRYRWELPKTIGLTLIASGLILKAPPLCWLIDRNVLHGLYLLVAHILITSGIASIAYSAERKLRPDYLMRAWHITRIVLPWVVGTGVMVWVFAAGGDKGLDQRFQFQPGWTTAYWLAYDALIIYFLLLAAQALGHLFYDPPSRRGAGLYLVAVMFGLICGACRAILATVDDDVPNTLLVNVANTTSAIAITLFSIGGAYMWRARLRDINRRRGRLPKGVTNIT